MDAACLDFMNSAWHDHRGSGRAEDRLDNPAWVDGFLARWNLEGPPPLDAATRATLVETRTLLRRLTEAAATGRGLAPADVAALNAIMGAAPTTRRLIHDTEAYRVEAVPLERTWAWALAEVVASFADLVVRRDLHRLKVCANPACRWVFYDASNSRTRRWCADTCATLVKVRRYRAQQQERRSDATGQREHAMEER